MALVETAEAGRRAATLGATVLRLRAPAKSTRELETEIAALVPAVAVPVIVTSRVDLALAYGAAGVHLTEGDLPVDAARGLLPDRLIGRSVHSVEAAREFAEAGVDYLLFGPVWATPTHPSVLPLGPEKLRAAVTAAGKVPVLAVGGVDTAHTERCMRAGAAGWAAIRMYA